MKIEYCRAQADLQNLVCATIDRRAFLLQSLGLVASLGGLGLTACGGSNSGSGSQQGAPPLGTSGTLVNVSVAVLPPSGFTLAQTSLVAANIFGIYAVPAGGAISVQVISNGPNLVYVQDASGNTLMLGFVDPGQASNTLGAASTAVVLVYAGLDAYGAPEASRSRLLQLLQVHPAVGTLAATIAARLVASPLALQDADAQIIAALKTAVAAIIATPNAAAPVAAAQRRGVATQSALASRNRPARLAASAAATPALVSIQPTGQVGGTQITIDSASNGFVATNLYRRYDRIYVYETATVDANNVTTTFPTVQPFAGPISLNSTENLSLFNALGDVFTATSPYSPVSIPPEPLTLVSGTNKTLYDIVVLGSATNPDAPAFFGNPQYANVVATWQQDVSFLTLKAWFVDIFFALVLDAIGVRAIIVNDAAIDGAIAGLIAIEDTAWQAALQQARSGAMGQAALVAMQRLVEDDLVSAPVMAQLYKIFANAKAASAAAVSAASLKTYVGVFLRVVANVATAAFGALGTGDMFLVFKDISYPTNQGDLWNVVLAKPQVNVNPPSSTVAAGSRVTLTASLPTSVLGTVVFDWTQNGQFATLSGSDGTVGNSLIKTADTVVDLVTTPSDQGTITVTVTAYTANGTVYTEIGKGVATVTLTPPSTGQALPGNLVLIQSQPGTAGGYTTVEVIYFYEFQLVSGAQSYYYLDNNPPPPSAPGSTQEITVLTAAGLQNGTPPVWDPSTWIGGEDAQTSFASVPRFYNSPLTNLGNGLVGFAPGTGGTAQVPSSATAAELAQAVAAAVVQAQQGAANAFAQLGNSNFTIYVTMA